MAEWHALAKLRMHTGTSLKLLEELTTELGQLFRIFRHLTCTQFATVELPREAAARAREQNRKKQAALIPGAQLRVIDNSTQSVVEQQNGSSQESGVAAPSNHGNLLVFL